ncbi:MAG TPA: hypothetical protein PLC04_04385 [Candidatus Kapabacteria bacterium]|nr:hypothetical protein [Candidatus Kapabacteria bacterium]
MKKNEIIDKYFEIYGQFHTEIDTRIDDFAKVPPERYFYELAYCICTPMSKAENALQVQMKLQKYDFIQHPFNPVKILSDPQHYIRFHNQKAKYIMENMEQFEQIQKILDDDIDNFSKRNMLAKKVRGFSLKESSHFMRNIGYKGLAILDRHILRNLKELELIEKDFKINNWKDYFKVEKIYKDFAEHIYFDSDILDLVLWAKETGKVIK